MSICIYKCDIGGNSITKSFVLRTEGYCGGAPQLASSETNAELESLEKKLVALERRLRESDEACSVRNAHIADLLGSLGETNKSIRNLENSNKRIKAALTLFGILFTLSIVLAGFRYYFTILISSTNQGISQDIFQSIAHGITQAISVLSQYISW